MPRRTDGRTSRQHHSSVITAMTLKALSTSFADKTGGQAVAATVSEER
jgi:hypothetical protein